MIRRCALAAIAAATLVACGGKARNADSYRVATQTLLETRSAQLEACYQAALAKDPDLAGAVTVRFTVEKRTGLIRDAKVDQSGPAHTSLVGCVLEAMRGLVLTPPDRNEGQATFVYDFRPAPAPT